MRPCAPSDRRRPCGSAARHQVRGQTMAELEGEWLARLPFGMRRAVIRLTVAAMDSTQPEKEQTSGILRQLAKAEGIPSHLSHLVTMLGSLVEASEAEVHQQQLVGAGILGAPS